MIKQKNKNKIIPMTEEDKLSGQLSSLGIYLRYFINMCIHFGIQC